jgi:hypothetical protein
MMGAVAVTGGDVVFAGEITGDFLVFDVNDGNSTGTMSAVQSRAAS